MPFKDTQIKGQVYPAKAKRELSESWGIQGHLHGPWHLDDGRCGTCSLCWLSHSSCPSTESIHLAQPQHLCLSTLPLDSSFILLAPVLPPLLPSPDPSHCLPLERCSVTSNAVGEVLELFPTCLLVMLLTWSLRLITLESLSPTGMAAQRTKSLLAFIAHSPNHIL